MRGPVSFTAPDGRFPLHRPLSTLLFAVSAIAGQPQAVAQDLSAEALNGTVTLDSGFLPDPYVIGIVPGGDQTVENLADGCTGYIYAASPDLKLQLNGNSSQLGIFVVSGVDTTLIINDPRGNWHCNDDSEYLDNANPGIYFADPLPGLYDIWVGTYGDVGVTATGSIAITELNPDSWLSFDFGDNTPAAGLSASDIDFGDDLSPWSNNNVCDDPRFTGSGMTSLLLDSDLFHDATDCRTALQAGTITLLESSPATPDNLGNGTLRGRLESNDSVLPGHGYADRYTFRGEAGGSAVINLRSAEFDTFLQVTTPSGEVYMNDDYEGSYEQSLLSFQLEENGEYLVDVSSYGSGITGAYTLEMDSSVGNTPVSQRNAGSLASGDSTYSSGEYYDTYTFEGRPGQTITIDLSSADFDTYLILDTPDGDREVNDDSDTASHSQITRQLSALGTYTVRVTSYSASETGDYLLAIDLQSPNDSQEIQRDTMNISAGETARGQLEMTDNWNENHRYEDVFVFSGNPGESLSITLESSAFDPYLQLIAPSGMVLENDDYQGAFNLSRIDLTLNEAGRYRILASSYYSDNTGAYSLTLTSNPQGTSGTPVTEPRGGRIYGIFMGIADYPGTENDLDLTDQDAVRARDALMTGAGMTPDSAWTLLNENATLGNFSTALSTISDQSNPDDMLVIFYSGHGSQEPRPGGPDNTDPDGLDESIVLYDSLLLDDELDAMLDNLKVGKILLVFDSCYSGGFAKDVVSAPGRMGFFSSEEDVTSQVAYKFQAGGFLSLFFDDAIRGGYADGDLNSEVTAFELSQYLHERYRYDVKAYGDEAASIRIAGPQASYQHLVVDRGGINAQSVLFYR